MIKGKLKWSWKTVLCLPLDIKVESGAQAGLMTTLDDTSCFALSLGPIVSFLIWYIFYMFHI